MKIVISPAKTLDFESKLPTARATQPKFLEKAEMINNKLERKSKKAIGKLMDVTLNSLVVGWALFFLFKTIKRLERMSSHPDSDQEVESQA